MTTNVGTPPAPDAPSLEGQASANASIEFPPSPSAADICGFKIPPRFTFNLSVQLPIPNFKLPLPFNLSIALKCDLSDPLDAEVSFGGGRTPTGAVGAQAEDRDY